MHDAFDDNPTPVNATLAAVGLAFGLALVSFVAIKGCREQTAVDAADRQSLQPRSMRDPSILPTVHKDTG